VTTGHKNMLNTKHYVAKVHDLI